MKSQEAIQDDILPKLTKLFINYNLKITYNIKIFAFYVSELIQTFFSFYLYIQILTIWIQVFIVHLLWA